MRVTPDIADFFVSKRRKRALDRCRMTVNIAEDIKSVSSIYHSIPFATRAGGARMGWLVAAKFAGFELFRCFVVGEGSRFFSQQPH